MLLNISRVKAMLFEIRNLVQIQMPKILSAFLSLFSRRAEITQQLGLLSSLERVLGAVLGPGLETGRGDRVAPDREGPGR